MAAMDTDGERVIRNVILGPCDRPVLFMKQMAHHLVDISTDFLADTINVLLIRDPVQMLPSLAQTLETPTLRDTGLALQTELYRYLRQMGQEPPILDAKQLLDGPPVSLGAALHADWDWISRRICSRGRPGPLRRTACGPSTGITQCTRRPASCPTGRRPLRFPPSWSRCWTNASRITSCWRSMRFGRPIPAKAGMTHLRDLWIPERKAHLAVETVGREASTMTPTLPDPRNADILVHVGGELLPSDQAKVSVLRQLRAGRRRRVGRAARLRRPHLPARRAPGAPGRLRQGHGLRRDPGQSMRSSRPSSTPCAPTACATASTSA